jgi:two-component system, OmpR family, alkaline phosphatase synthesis response regulator PhoP
MSSDTKKVLVVDDEKDLRDAVKTALVYEGFEVEVAEDGVEGYAKAREMHPDLILLDILMPKQNGIDMLKAIRKESWGKDTQVIIMTVLDDMAKISEALESGANEYLVKTDVSLGGIVEKVKAKFG